VTAVAALTVVALLAVVVLGGLVLGALVRRERGGEEMDRRSAERTARRDTEE
jgi:hypothetical protein